GIVGRIGAKGAAVEQQTGDARSRDDDAAHLALFHVLQKFTVGNVLEMRRSLSRLIEIDERHHQQGRDGAGRKNVKPFVPRRGGIGLRHKLSAAVMTLTAAVGGWLVGRTSVLTSSRRVRIEYR